ncbi:MAG: (Fe-S)-binding protein [Deltaproteobacteria bacterium]|nr:(Fe-S)-binding protein [Deltaproteobacteria bacterium]
MDLLEEYIKEGRIKLNTTKIHHRVTIHDPCNYVRKSQMAFGDHMGEKTRWIVNQCIDPSLYREMIDDPMNNLCCGAGGGAWAMPYDEERLKYGSMKSAQIKATGAEIVVAPCHNCRDQIMKGLAAEHKKGREGFDMGNYEETLYLWEMVANVLDIEPWTEEEQAKAKELRDAQFERDGIELEEE